MKNKQPKFSETITECSYMIHCELGRKLFQRAMNCSLNKNNKTILIIDILIGDEYIKSIFNNSHYSKYINKGYGTRMMNMLLEFAKENGYKKITGELSDVDANSVADPTHRERQIYFYKKFGFKILPNEETPQEIELILE